MPPAATRTFNPLPFEHLEPKRFEDLARQLAYDFKPWRQLEATGRTGSDDGFDARGYEIMPAPDLPSADSDDEVIDEGATDRLWLIQCKRERSIGPTKMRAHLEAIPPVSRVDLYGLIFVAACDFSKKTRDTLRSWCAEQGIAECHVWGKAELEDMLYQPKNDNLLFAYFGISLQIRRQKTAANLRRVTTIKRKLRRLIEKNDQPQLHILLRDPTDDRFPFTDGVSFDKGKFLWRVVKVQGLGLFGLRIVAREHFAFLDRERKHWDVATGVDLSIPDEHSNPWHERQVTEAEKNLEEEARHFWLSLNDQLTAFFFSEIAYDEIIEIDEVGNDDFSLATVFVPFKNGKMPEVHRSDPVIAQSSDLEFGCRIDGNPENVRVFPDEFRDAEFEKLWSQDYDFTFSKDPYEFDLNPPAWVVELRKRKAEGALNVPTPSTD